MHLLFFYRMPENGIKRGLKAKSKGYLKLGQLYCISIDSILLDETAPEIFYCKYNIEASMILIFISNPDVDNIGNAIPVQF